MASLEEVMAGLFGGNMAPAADDPRRRRGPGSGGYEGIGGAGVSPGQILPYFMNQPVYDYSGPMASRMGGRNGLMSLLGESKDLAGPALRHFQNQGFDFMPPGQIDNPGIGGPNIAPGNIDDALALDQPTGNQTPGVPQGVARGQAPGRVVPAPHSQGWRNVAGGYSAAAQYGYGTPSFGSHFAPGQALPPGSMGGNEGGRGFGAGGQEGGTVAGGRPVTDSRQAPGGLIGPGPQPTPGPGPSGGGQGGGGKKEQAPKPGGMPSSSGKPGGTTNTSGGRGGGAPDVNPVKFIPKGDGGSNLITVPNKGNNNTPIEMTGGIKKGGKPKTAPPKPPPSNTTPSEANAAKGTGGKTKKKGGKVGSVTSGGWQTGGGF